MTALERTQQLTVAKDVFNLVYGQVGDYLPSCLVAKPNSRYGTKDILEYAILMCDRGCSCEGISQIHHDKAYAYAVPSGACLLNRLGKTPYSDMRTSCDNMLAGSLQDARVSIMLRKPVITSTDEHDVPAKFKDLDEEFMAKGRPKGGTSKRIRYTTVRAAIEHLGFTVAIHPTGRKYSKEDTVRYLLEKIRSAGIRSKLHLLDRGFYKAAVIDTLIDMDQKFLMPAVKNKAIKKLIKEYSVGKRGPVSRYTIQGKNHKATITIAIVKRKDAVETDPIEDQYLAFATNASMQDAMANLANLPTEYKKRWGIETGYRCAKQVRPKTCSRNPSYRLFLFYFTMILYNVWTIVNHAVGWNGMGSNGRYRSPPMPMYRMVAAFATECEKMLHRGVVVGGPFFADTSMPTSPIRK